MLGRDGRRHHSRLAKPRLPGKNGAPVNDASWAARSASQRVSTKAARSARVSAHACRSCAGSIKPAASIQRRTTTTTERKEV